ncbi:MAG: TVP38/TMEM64 family protein [Acidobacteria bacterium]|nr:MAG: TVP38/TMEM64 family protein [Acidobacteriota bacterium]
MLRGWLQTELARAGAWGPGALYGLYLALGAVRGFTLVPSTTLVLAALPFFPPGPLLVATIAGIMLSSASIYYGSAALRLDERLAKKHPEKIARLTDILNRYELPIIIGWSFFPLAPTDLICYVCGVLRVRFWKFLLGVTLGEGAICALYIYSGDQFLRWLGFRQ